MKLISQKIQKLEGIATIPASKSHTIRALILATLAVGTSRISNALDCEDTRSAIAACQALGARISFSDDKNIMVESSGVPLSPTADRVATGNSGITTNFLLPMLGLRKNNEKVVILDCDEQMRQRPVEPLLKSLADLGMEIESINGSGTLPVSVRGALKGGETTVDGSNSQYLSALLLSLPLALQDSKIIVQNLQERPYVEMTCRYLDDLGVQYKQNREQGKDVFEITGGQRYRSFSKSIPGDFSSASYIIAAAVMVPGSVTVRGLDMNDSQGDKRLIPILRDMGVDIQVNEDELVINGGAPLQGRRIDCSDIPDLVPTLAVIGTYAEGATELVNIAHVRSKETDRIQSMEQGLSALGAKINGDTDRLTVSHSRLRGTAVHGHNDHRTIMALTLAGLLASGQTSIDTAEAVDKTFPTFPAIMAQLGARVSLKQ